MNSREIILDILLEMERNGEFSSTLIKGVLDKYDYLPPQEKAFIKRVTEGSIERQIELDFILNQFSSVPVRKMKPLIRCLMRMSVYQLLYMDAVPDSAVCNEAVKLAAKRKFQSLKGFVNGILRNISRNKESIAYPNPEKEPQKSLSIRYSMPLWLVALWEKEYGRERTERLLEGLLRIHPVSIRFVEALDKEKLLWYIAQMEKQGITVTPSTLHSRVYLLSGVEGVAALPGYEEGAFTVQDASSALSVEAAKIHPGDFVMDICAAPGGKSLFASEKAGKEGRILSSDVREEKLERMEENARRLHADNITVREWDGRQLDPSYVEKADVVLLDVPCSGLGVMGKKRDIKYHVTPEGLEELSKLQREIVSGSWQYVRPGGVLLYSTCTIRKEENEEMAAWIERTFPFTLEESKQLMPGEDDCDGFFFARLRRKQD